MTNKILFPVIASLMLVSCGQEQLEAPKIKSTTLESGILTTVTDIAANCTLDYTKNDSSEEVALSKVENEFKYTTTLSAGEYTKVKLVCANDKGADTDDTYDGEASFTVEQE